MKASIVVIGAHPDDAEVKAAGTAIHWVRAGFDVTFVSVTDGSAGHHQSWGDELVQRRRTEAQTAANALGVRTENMGYPDGLLQPTLEARLDVVRLLRRLKADLCLTHRPNDYHPDHRYTSLLVQDAAYMVTVPAIAPNVPALAANPVFGYLSDRFQKPLPFSADVVVGIDDVVEKIVESLDCHESQFYEWLPFNMGILDHVPMDRHERRRMLEHWYRHEYALKAAAMPKARRPPGATLVEAFEISEYGAPLTDEKRRWLFP